MTTVVGPAMGMVLEREQRGRAKGRFEVYVATVATIATIGTTLGDMCLAPKRHSTSSAVAGFEVYLRLIYERGHVVLRRRLGAMRYLVPSALARIRPARCAESGSALAGDHVDETSATSGTEVHPACGLGEECVVLAASDVDPWVEVRAALTDDDRSGADALAVGGLHTKALRVRVAAVTSGAAAFGLGHLCS
jgi:hypothetical protein